MRRFGNKVLSAVLTALLVFGNQPFISNASEVVEETVSISEESYTEKLESEEGTIIEMEAETATEGETATEDKTVTEEEIETEDETVTEKETETEDETTTEKETETEDETVTEKETETEDETVSEEETETEDETVTEEETETEEETTTEEETISEEEAALAYRIERLTSNAQSVFTEDDFIKADGKNLRNQSGKGELINLRGTNAGGYLLQEFWMTPTDYLTDISAENDIYRYISEEYGEEELYNLVEIYQQSYWEEEDFDRCKDMGMNVIRLPFWYRNLVDEQGEFYGYDENAEDPYAEAFATLDWFVTEANARGIYVIIDFHGAPGSQNGSDHSGVDGRDYKEQASEFFFGDNAKNNQKLFYEMWKVIAERYEGNPGVAGYDLMNEPYCTYRYNSVLTSGEDELHSMLWEIYDKAYDIIRSVDKDHVIIMEATWNPVDLPHPNMYGWENIMYEYHNYLYDDYDNVAGAQISNMQKKVDDIAMADYNVPSYLGEFCYFNNLDAWDEGLDLLTQAGINWTTWTYKTVDEYGNWGLYHHTPEFNDGIDLENVALEEMLEWYSRMDEVEPNEGLIEVVSNYCRKPVVENVLKPDYAEIEEGEYYLSAVETGQIVVETESGLAATAVDTPEASACYIWKLSCNEDESVSLQNVESGKYISVHTDDQKLYADAEHITDAEKFYVIKTNQIKIALKSKSEQYYITMDAENDYVLTATAQAAGDTEAFYLYSKDGINIGISNLPIHSGWTRYEAEEAEIVGDGAREEEQGFYSENKAVTELNNGCDGSEVEDKLSNVKHVNFTVNVEKDGEYELVINYNGDDDKKVAYQVNDDPVEILGIERQAGGQWDAMLEKYVRVNLVKGENHIRLSGVLNNNGWINYDSIDLCDSPIKETNGKKRFEGENYFHTGVEESQSFFSNGKGVGYLNIDTALDAVKDDWSNVNYVTFTLYAEEEDNYTVTWAFNGNGADGMKALYQLNGQDDQIIVVNNQGASWDRMNYVSFDVTLKKGFNTLKIAGTLEDKNNWANMDYIELELQGAAESYSGYTIYEAEKAYINGGMVETHNFYSGKKGVGDLVNSETKAEEAKTDWNDYRYVEFTVNAPVAGEYPLFVTYNGDDDKEILLCVNNQEQKIIAVSNVSEDKAWDRMHTFHEVVILKQGENKIALTGVMGEGWINYDYIQLAKYPLVITDAEKGTVRFEAEHYNFQSVKSYEEAVEQQDFYSAGYGVGGMGGQAYMEEGTDIKKTKVPWIAYTIFVEKAGEYEFSVAMNGNGANIKAAYQVDEEASHIFMLPNEGKAWNDMSFGTFTAELTKGYHEVVVSGAISDTWDDWVNYDYMEMTLVKENVSDEPSTNEPTEPGEPSTDEPTKPEKPSAGTSKPAKPSAATGSTSSKSNTTTQKTVQIMPEEVPMAMNMDENGLPYMNISFKNKEAKLKYDLLKKYYGRNLYLLAHLENGVGFSMDMENMNTDKWKELNLSTSMEELKNFAEGFATFHIKPYQKAKLDSSIGIHMNLGKEYTGKTAYLFQYQALTSAYELNKVTVVNEIGNVAVNMNELTDIVVLVKE